MSKQVRSDDAGRWRLGNDAIGDYMRRWFFWCPWFGIRIHHILRSDADRHLHDHPWSFVSLILWGAYYEVTQCCASMPCCHHYPSPRFRRWGVRHKATDYHRLVLYRPAWTLVLTGPKTNHWGFLTERGKVPWREYLGISNDDGGY